MKNHSNPAGVFHYDVLLKSMFDAHISGTVGFLNFLFGEHIDIKDPNPIYLSAESSKVDHVPKNHYGDRLLQLGGTIYHVEFQTFADREMNIRMMRYMLEIYEMQKWREFKKIRSGVFYILARRETVKRYEQKCKTPPFQYCEGYLSDLTSKRMLDDRMYAYAPLLLLHPLYNIKRERNRHPNAKKIYSGDIHKNVEKKADIGTEKFEVEAEKHWDSFVSLYMKVLKLTEEYEKRYTISIKERESFNNSMRYIKDYAITNELVPEESFKEVSEMGREITMADLMKEVNEHYVERGRIKGLREGKAAGKIEGKAEGKAEGIRLMLERLGEKSNILFDLLTDEEKAMIEAKTKN